MNEQIGRLAEQAALLGPSSRVGNAHEATEKFAELIIQECINKVEVWETDSRNHISYMLKQHFGVK